MSQMLVILLRQDGLVCWCVAAGHIKEVLNIGYELKLLLAWLRHYPQAQVQLIVDLIEEEVYIEASPSLFQWEQSVYAAKQLRKRFPKTEFSRTLLHSVQVLPWQTSSGLLLVAGFNEDTLLIKVTGWLDAAQIAVTGIYSSVSLIPSLFEQLFFSSKARRNALAKKAYFLLMRTGKDTFRQLLMVNGQLRSTREVQLRDKSLLGQMQQLLQEVKLLDKFVHAQRILDYSVVPSLYYLGEDQEDIEIAWSVFQHSPYIETPATDQFIAASSLMEDKLAVGIASDSLLMLNLVNHPKASDYLPPIVKQAQQVKHIKTGVWLAVFAVIVALILYFVDFLIKQHSYDDSMSGLQVQHQRYQQYLTELNKKNSVGLDPAILKLSVELVDQVESVMLRQQLAPYLLSLSQVLAKHPTIQVKGVIWESLVKKSNNPNVVVNKTIDLTEFSVELSATIVVDNATRLKTVLDMMESFLATLTHSAQIAKVDILQKPVDLDSSRPLTIKAEESMQIAIQAFPFKLKIMFKDLPSL